MTAPYPIEKMRQFIVEKYPHNDNMCHPDYKAGALMSAILRWWDDEEKPSLDSAEALIRENVDRMNAQAKRIAELEEFIRLQSAQFVEGNKKTAERIAELEGDLKYTRLRNERLEYHLSQEPTDLNNADAANRFLISETNSLGAKIAKQRAALKKLGKAKRARGKALVEALDSLKRIECQFAPCPGPNEPFVDMTTCHRCYAIQTIEKQLRQEGKL